MEAPQDLVAQDMTIKADVKKEGGGGEACAVCGDRSTGIHYRVQSCEGCKGFWRRTIQRGMGERYACKLWTEQCQVTPESRGRCQRCRYLACVRAGMVADLVMADKERLSRLRLVDQNRERRRKEKVGEGVKSEKEEEVEKQDARVLELVVAVHGATLGAGEGGVAGAVRGAFTFLESLMFQLMGQRDLRELLVSAHTEVAVLHLLASLGTQGAAATPLLGELATSLTSLAPREVLLAMLLAGTRPRLTWPLASAAELAVLWDLLSGIVQRSCPAPRLAGVLQVVHQAQQLTHYLPPLTLLSTLEQVFHRSPPRLPATEVPHTSPPPSAAPQFTLTPLQEPHTALHTLQPPYHTPLPSTPHQPTPHTRPPTFPPTPHHLYSTPTTRPAYHPTPVQAHFPPSTPVQAHFPPSTPQPAIFPSTPGQPPMLLPTSMAAFHGGRHQLPPTFPPPPGHPPAYQPHRPPTLPSTPGQDQPPLTQFFQTPGQQPPPRLPPFHPPTSHASQGMPSPQLPSSHHLRPPHLPQHLPPHIPAPYHPSHPPPYSAPQHPSFPPDTKGQFPLLEAHQLPPYHPPTSSLPPLNPALPPVAPFTIKTEFDPEAGEHLTFAELQAPAPHLPASPPAGAPLSPGPSPPLSPPGGHQEVSPYSIPLKKRKLNMEAPQYYQL